MKCGICTNRILIPGQTYYHDEKICKCSSYSKQQFEIINKLDKIMSLLDKLISKSDKNC